MRLSFVGWITVLTLVAILIIGGGIWYVATHAEPFTPEIKTEQFENPYESKPDYPDPREVFCLTHPKACKG